MKLLAPLAECHAGLLLNQTGKAALTRGDPFGPSFHSGAVVRVFDQGFRNHSEPTLSGYRQMQTLDWHALQLTEQDLNHFAGER
ncbi:hypothetical protein [Aquamicrobium terrae]